MGVAISGPTYFYGGNMLFITNTKRPEYTLKKKKQRYMLPCTQRVHRYGRHLTGHIWIVENPSDLETEIMAKAKNNSWWTSFDTFDEHDNKDEEC